MDKTCITVKACPPNMSSQISVWARRLRNPPLVSCICPANGRADLLEEAIYSFLQQDYPGGKELIVLNDSGGQTLAFDHPNVHIVNLPRRFHSMGEKFNALAALASHDLVLVWPEDAISLPHRISFMVSRLQPRHGFFNVKTAWFWKDGQLRGLQHKAFHGGALWTRNLFVKVRGYPHVRDGHDTSFEQLCREHAPDWVDVQPTSPENAYYIHREPGTSSAGDAGESELPDSRDADELGRSHQGQIKLKPRWRADYLGLVQDYLAKRAGEEPFPPPF